MLNPFMLLHTFSNTSYLQTVEADTNNKIIVAYTFAYVLVHCMKYILGASYSKNHRWSTNRLADQRKFLLVEKEAIRPTKKNGKIDVGQ